MRPAAICAMRQPRGACACLVLFAKGAPVAFTCACARVGDTLQYLGGGERDDFRQWSAGTILHLAALRLLFADGCFRLLDFRPGESEVKRQFANGSLRAATVLQLKRTLFHRLLLGCMPCCSGGMGQHRHWRPSARNPDPAGRAGLTPAAGPGLRPAGNISSSLRSGGRGWSGGVSVHPFDRAFGPGLDQSGFDGLEGQAGALGKQALQGSPGLRRGRSS